MQHISFKKSYFALLILGILAVVSISFVVAESGFATNRASTPNTSADITVIVTESSESDQTSASGQPVLKLTPIQQFILATELFNNNGVIPADSAFWTVYEASPEEKQEAEEGTSPLNDYTKELIEQWLAELEEKKQKPLYNSRLVVPLLELGGKTYPPALFQHDVHTERLISMGVNPTGALCLTCHPQSIQAGSMDFSFQGYNSKEQTGSVRQYYHVQCQQCHANPKRFIAQKLGMVKDSLQLAERAEGALPFDAPLAAECKRCHIPEKSQPVAVTHQQEREPLYFMPSLHVLHGFSPKIQPLVLLGQDTLETEQKCIACHHSYNEETQKLERVAGKETSCRACHSTRDVNNINDVSGTNESGGTTGQAKQTKQIGQAETLSFKTAVHSRCISCHLTQQAKAATLATTGKENVFITCTGCHAHLTQDQYEINEEQEQSLVSVYATNQPKTVIFGTFRAETRKTEPTQTDSAETPATEEEPALENAGSRVGVSVLFNHETHAKNILSCQSCHHTGELMRCRTCHASGESSAIASQNKVAPSLKQAFHAPNVQQSCVGCHEQEKTKPQCAGCHSMVSVQKTEQSCMTCHTSGLHIKTTEVTRNVQVSLLKYPEIVVIGHLQDEYNAVEYAHGKIIRRLEDSSRQSGLSRLFHTKPEFTCVTCHHNGSFSGFETVQILLNSTQTLGGQEHSQLTPWQLEQPLQRPLSCIQCHNKEESLGVNGVQAVSLQKAYHLRCMQCHASMDLNPFKSTSCTSCHTVNEKGE